MWIIYDVTLACFLLVFVLYKCEIKGRKDEPSRQTLSEYVL